MIKKLSTDQQYALDALVSWQETAPTPFITLGGYAGTGKTTLLGQLRTALHEKNKKLRVSFCSYTGKATRVMKSKLVSNAALQDQDSISTIHGLLYTPILDDKENITGWKRKDEVECDLIIIDEASMIDKTIWNDLLSYHIPIIAVGDHGQLPPIRGTFNVMEHPNLRLEEIHRQAKGNPIIEVSVKARLEGTIPVGTRKSASGLVHKVSKRDGDAQDDIAELLKQYTYDTLVLCGYNTTRVKLNTFIRQALGFETIVPHVNDRVICLRNDHTAQIYNGMLGMIRTITVKNNDWYETEIDMDDERNTFRGCIASAQFNNTSALNFSKDRQRTKDGNLFDFGYALTVHKAQGSQAKRVVLFEERFRQMDDEMWRRWLYTAVTRAQQELYIVGE